MAKSDDLKEAFLAEFGEQATQTRTGKLLGFDQLQPEPETPPQSDQE